MSSTSLDILRRLFLALDARVDLDVRWRGGEIDRLVDAAHARLGSLLATALRQMAWRVLPEVTFMRFGERGAIDLLAWDEKRRAALLVELKSELTSYEETQRRLDVKSRVAASVTEERLGWRPRQLGVVLVLSDTRTNRDRAARVAPLLEAALPAANVEIRRWLRSPVGELRGVWFVPDMPQRTGNHRPGGPHHVRTTRGQVC